MIRTLILSLALGIALASPATAQKLSLGALSNYLNSFQTAAGEFTQVNADGTISTGTIFIKRPGRVRFEYNPPDNSLVMAGGGQVAVFDSKSNTGPEQFPLKQTPLNLILQKNVDLTRARMVVGHSSDGKSTTVVAQDPERPELGTIQLVFTSNPTELRQWVITDGGGERTTVILGQLEKGVSLGSRMFNIPHETAARSR
ncbi:outer membrane lipoprotein-sorting protein [Aliiruegeria haliotis]|uniref:Outer membrane lipoprotein-sorting protein n=1 Tax=Aliiruegeria haliotis TaxID=1280846 RepID=A0A2T0RIE4_9RHOB|nr:outer membrane lipoprotein carrier protein LolA [Aliiruegeria haliotis]PRY20901.1 outer membrane lipoprotein-sorting protein [Aliiruegeria haliotis]